MSNITLESKFERAFQDDVIFRYPEGTSMNQLKHNFLAERRNAKDETVSSEGFYTIKQEIVELDEDVMRWHMDKYRTELNKFDASPEANVKKDQYRNDPRFKKAFEFLGIDWEKNKSKIYLPWWAEVLASQVSHEQLPDGSYQATFAPMHPFELQLVKRGLDLPVKATSTLGVLITEPDAQSQEGYVVLGIRTGAGHANTYHVVPAGYLQASEKFMKGEKTIYDGFVEDELTPESGLDITDLSEIRPLAIVHDHI